MLIEELPQGFGARVGGFDVQAGRAREAITALQRAYDRHHLLVFRDCGRITPERQVEISRWFGEVPEDNDGQGNAWTVLQNSEASGRSELPFHSDITFFEFPCEGICLHPTALPRVATSTTFVSNATAWASLPPDLQDDLRGRTARHFYDSSADMDFDWPVLEYWHPVAFPEPRTGAPMLFVTEHHVDRISGLSEAEGAAVLADLFARLYAPERRYEHIWREGDLVVWNNFAVQHARTREASPADGPRALQRVSIGRHTFSQQLEQLLKARAAANA